MECNFCSLRIDCIVQPKKPPVEVELWPTSTGVRAVTKTPDEFWDLPILLTSFLFSIGFSTPCNNTFERMAELIQADVVREGLDFEGLEVTANLIEQVLEEGLVQITVSKRR